MFKARVKDVYDRCKQRSSKPLYNNKVEIVSQVYHLQQGQSLVLDSCPHARNSMIS